MWLEHPQCNWYVVVVHCGLSEFAFLTLFPWRKLDPVRNKIKKHQNFVRIFEKFHSNVFFQSHVQVIGFYIAITFNKFSLVLMRTLYLRQSAVLSWLQVML